MQSTIIATTNPTFYEKKIAEAVDTHHISQFDITRVGEEENVGIGIVRQIQKSIRLKPLKSKTKLLVIQNAQDITTEAQNALLKLLEEPPDHTFIILITSTLETLLPTVISRCNVIQDPTQQITENSPFPTDVYTLSKLSINGKLRLAQDITKTKEITKAWLMACSQAGEKTLKNQPDLQTTHFLHSLFQLTKLIQSTNTNPRLAVENYLLSLTV